MATATQSQGKTSFVKEFLHDNPQAKAKAVNEAWQAAGMKGTISHPVISEVRKQLGLIGNLRGKTSTAAKGKAAPNILKTATTPGKPGFVKRFLNDNPHAKAKAVNEAWQAAGFQGTISTALINRMRAVLGLTGNRGGKTKQKTSQAKARTKPRDRRRG